MLERPEPIDLIVVETTGLADPLPVALSFMAGDLRERLRLDSIITVIDAEHSSATALESPIARAQEESREQLNNGGHHGHGHPGFQQPSAPDGPADSPCGAGPGC